MLLLTIVAGASAHRLFVSCHLDTDGVFLHIHHFPESALTALIHLSNSAIAEVT